MRGLDQQLPYYLPQERRPACPCGKRGQKLSGNAVQKILATLWTFEPAIEPLHPEHRVDNVYSSSLRKKYFLLKGLRRHETDFSDALEELLNLHKMAATDTILWAHTLNLADTMGERGSYNFRNLRGTNPIKQTIGFGQDQSMLDPVSISHWIKLCVGLIDFAHRVPLEILAPFLLLHIDDDLQEFNIVQLLKALGLPQQMLFYGSKPLHKHVLSKAKSEKWREESPNESEGSN